LLLSGIDLSHSKQEQSSREEAARPPDQGRLTHLILRGLMENPVNSPVVGEAGRHVAHSIAVGAVCGLLAIVQSIGFGTLLFSGAPKAIAGAGMGMALLTSAVMALISLGSTNRGIIATAQSVPAAAMAGIVAAVLARMHSADDAAVLATAIAVVAVTTLLIGAGTWLLGAFRLSRFIRFLPYPVISGFLAGTGWLVLIGGIDAIAGTRFLGDPLGVVSDPAAQARGAAGLAVIAFIIAFQKLTAWRLALPATIAGALLLFNLVVLVAGIPAATLRATHWLIVVPDGNALWPAISFADIGHIDWSAIVSEIPGLLTVPVLALIALLMNATGIELDARQDLDLDRELRSAGVANLIAGAGGGLPGYHSVSLTILASRLAAADLITSLTVSIACAAAVVLGGRIVSLIPTPLLGAVLIWIGGGLIRQWLISAHARLARAEYAVVVLIFAIIAFVGFAWGILVGLIAAAILFAVEYGRVDIVRYTLTGRDYQTSAVSSSERLELLRNNGDAILLLRLQGYLFFGTAERLRKRIQQRMASTQVAGSRFLVIDFDRVSGLDSSAVLSFVRLSQSAAPEGFVLVLTGMSEAVSKAMLRGGLELGAGSHVRIEPSFDHGVEWCENALLARVAPKLATAESRPARDILTAVVGDAAFAEALIPYFERVEVMAGAPLIAQGTPSDDIFFIEAGRAAVELANNGQTIRLATLAHGAIVGEVAFYLSVPRSASVVAESTLVAWRFSRTNLERLRATEPEIAARFHQGIAAMLADRLTRTNRLIQLLAD
jgi:SulP family sulfate permease